MTDVYASVAELWAVVGAGTMPDAHEDRLGAALIFGTNYVRYRVGLDVTEDVDVEPPYTLVVVAAPAAYGLACIAAAVRAFKSADVPFGVLGMGEYGMNVKASIPEADLLLFGQREAFGFA